MRDSIEIRFPIDHPTAAGHFPSDPIVPGALLLDEVVKAVAGKTGRDGKVTIRAAKFFRPVRPGDSIFIRWQSGADGAIAFECRLADDGMAAAGTLEIGPVPQ